MNLCYTYNILNNILITILLLYNLYYISYCTVTAKIRLTRFTSYLSQEKQQYSAVQNGYSSLALYQDSILLRMQLRHLSLVSQINTLLSLNEKVIHLAGCLSCCYSPGRWYTMMITKHYTVKRWFCNISFPIVYTLYAAVRINLRKPGRPLFTGLIKHISLLSDKIY